MATKKKRKGQHLVDAVVRVYSAEADRILREEFAKGATERATSVSQLMAEPYSLWYIEWRPRPSHNEYNTQSDWRRKIARELEGLYFDVLMVDYEWREVDA